MTILDKVILLAAGLIAAVGIWGFYHFSEASQLYRVLGVIVAILLATGVALTSGPGQAAWEFGKGSRNELRKVVWPTRRETVQGTLLVVALVVAVGLYLWVLDVILFSAVYDWILDVSPKTS